MSTKHSIKYLRQTPVKEKEPSRLNCGKNPCPALRKINELRYLEDINSHLYSQGVDEYGKINPYIPLKLEKEIDLTALLISEEEGVDEPIHIGSNEYLHRQGIHIIDLNEKLDTLSDYDPGDPNADLEAKATLILALSS